MKNDVNLRSYEGVESVQSVLADESFKKYCNKKLESCFYDLDHLSIGTYPLQHYHKED